MGRYFLMFVIRGLGMQDSEFFGGVVGWAWLWITDTS